MEDKIYQFTFKFEDVDIATYIPNEVWCTILEQFFFKIADTFGFMDVVEEKDLFPLGLEYFKLWDIEKKDIIELDNQIVCSFYLNEDCKKRLLQQEFAVHEIGMSPPRNYWEYDKEHFYYEFDELYFFSSGKLVGIFINHENMFIFKNLNEMELNLLEELNIMVTDNIMNYSDFINRYNHLFPTDSNQ